MYQVEYRYAFAPILTVGAAVHYLPFTLRANCEGASPTDGHVLSFTPRLHIRSSRYRDHESVVFFVGPTFSHVYQEERCYVDMWEPDVNFVEPRVSWMRSGLNFGIGYETDAFLFDAVRMRFYYDIMVPFTRTGVVWSSLAIGIGVHL